MASSPNEGGATTAAATPKNFSFHARIPAAFPAPALRAATRIPQNMFALLIAQISDQTHRHRQNVRSAP
jgi:hypothetical protein